MKSGRTLALTLGVASGALLALLASKSTKKIKQFASKNASQKAIQNDDSEVHYI